MLSGRLSGGIHGLRLAPPPPPRSPPGVGPVCRRCRKFGLPFGSTATGRRGREGAGGGGARPRAQPAGRGAGGAGPAPRRAQCRRRAWRPTARSAPASTTPSAVRARCAPPPVLPGRPSPAPPRGGPPGRGGCGARRTRGHSGAWDPHHTHPSSLLPPAPPRPPRHCALRGAGPAPEAAEAAVLGGARARTDGRLAGPTRTPPLPPPPGSTWSPRSSGRCGST